MDTPKVLTQVSATVTKELSWLQKHERIVIVALILAAGTFGWNRWIDHAAVAADARAAAAAQVVAIQDAASKALAAQSAQQMVLLNQQIDADKQEMASLVASIASRDADSGRRVIDVTGPKTPSQAVSDLSTAYILPIPVVPTADGADVPTVDLQQFTVAKITGDTAKQDLKDTQTELSSAQGVLATCVTTVDDLRKQTLQDQVDLKAHDTQAAADVKAVKADARKKERNWFFKGMATTGAIVVAIVLHGGI